MENKEIKDFLNEKNEIESKYNIRMDRHQC